MIKGRADDGETAAHRQEDAGLQPEKEGAPTAAASEAQRLTMLPSNVASLATFISLMLPGFIYDLRREKFTSKPIPSQLREVVQIVTASLLCNLGAVLLLAPVRFRFPGATPSVTAWLKSGNSYLAAHSELVFTWFFGFMALACLLAYLAADRRIRRRLSGPFKWATGGEVAAQSAWLTLSDLYDDVPYKIYIYVGCRLNDGTHLSGQLFSLSEKVEETADRELTVMAPVYVRKPGEEAAVILEGVDFVAVSARNIAWLEVSHYSSKDDFPKPAEIGLTHANGATGRIDPAHLSKVLSSTLHHVGEFNTRRKKRI